MCYFALLLQRGATIIDKVAEIILYEPDTVNAVVGICEVQKLKMRDDAKHLSLVNTGHHPFLSLTMKG